MSDSIGLAPVWMQRMPLEWLYRAASATEEDIHPDARGTEVLFTYPLFVLDELCRHSIKAGNDRYLFIKLTEKLRR
jgi:hypothetical protein